MAAKSCRHLSANTIPGLISLLFSAILLNSLVATVSFSQLVGDGVISQFSVAKGPYWLELRKSLLEKKNLLNFQSINL